MKTLEKFLDTFDLSSFKKKSIPQKTLTISLYPLYLLLIIPSLLVYALSGGFGEDWKQGID